MEKSLIQRILRILGSIIDILLIIAMLVVLFTIFNRDFFSKKTDIKALVVVSGSMEPIIPKGSLILIKKSDPASIEVGDIITFKVDLDDDNELDLVTHIVAEINSDGYSVAYKTKPNVVDEIDRWLIPSSDVLGEVEWSIPYLGYFALYLHKNAAPILLVLNVFVLTRLVINYLRMRDKNKDSSNSDHNS